MTDLQATARICRGPFNFAAGEMPPPADNWCFIAAGDRTGSNALARMLNLHPDCQILEEAGGLYALMVLFSSDYYAVAGPAGFVRCGCLSARDVRHLCEAWREVRGGGAQIVGDKQLTFWASREATRTVFPGCHIIVTVRHPLDALASTCACPWAAHLAAYSPEQKWEYLQHRCGEFTEAQDDETVAVVRFEDMAQGEVRRGVLAELWKGLGLPVTDELLSAVGDVDFDAPAGTLGKWREDRFAAEVVEFAGTSAVAELLASCGYEA